MAKRRSISAYLLIVVMILSTTGVTVARHYCGDRLISTSVATDKEDGSCCSMEGSDSCCKNEVETVAVDDDITISSQSVDHDVTLSAVSPIASIPHIESPSLDNNLERTNPPPLLREHGKSLPILLQSFLI
ncbi:MAG: hypothetical protein CL946_05795 [Ectothiorhodospiraceae bacterium]|nr:hypothetical protein [Ectothiorhodospiraceae bacterium]